MSMRIDSTVAGTALLVLLCNNNARAQTSPVQADEQPAANVPGYIPQQPDATSSGQQSAVGAPDTRATPSVAMPVSAAPPVTPAVGPVNPEAPLDTGPTPVKGKWSPTIYGFVEFDSVHDSTQSFSEVEGNSQISDPTTYAGKRGRTMFGVRNSRLGLKLNAPEMQGIRPSGILEMDFLGNQPGNPPAMSEGAYFASPTFRLRHFAMKLENEYVDILLGQYWQLFGWQSSFHVNTVQIQGVPGQVYSRAPQVRLSHTFKSSSVNLEVAVAASRPPQRDSGTPDGQAGVRVLLNDWKGVHTMGGTGTAADAAAIGVSGVFRRFVVPTYEAKPTQSQHLAGRGLSLDAMLPVIPGTMQERGNSLTLTGSWVVGQGISDLFTGLSNGSTASWALPDNTIPASSFAGIDPGLIEYGVSGVPHAIRWQSFLGGIQYYLPGSGRVWISANYSDMRSNNILRYVDAKTGAGLFHKQQWYDVNVFYDLNLATRFGVEYAHTRQVYGDESRRNNHRVQFSGWLIF
jgi:hypothetical protein